MLEDALHQGARLRIGGSLKLNDASVYTDPSSTDQRCGRTVTTSEVHDHVGAGDAIGQPLVGSLSTTAGGLQDLPGEARRSYVEPFDLSRPFAAVDHGFLTFSSRANSESISHQIASSHTMNSSSLLGI